MLRTTVSVADQYEMLDTLFAYAWALDRGDLDGVMETFAPDGAVVRMWGEAPERLEGLDAVRGMYENSMRNPNFRGGQHHIRPLFFEDTEGCYILHSYFQYLHTVAGEAPRIVNLGYYQDTFVKHDGEWRFQEKVIGPWNSDRSEAYAYGQPQTSPRQD